MSFTPGSASDPQVVARVLGLLRKWGWEAAEGSLREEISATTDPRARAELEVLTGWITAERGGHEEANTLFEAAEVHRELKAWAMVGRAFIAYRERLYDSAEQSLDFAAGCECDDHVLRATVEHLRGAIALMRGRGDDALNKLYSALDGLGLDHFGAGRVLDTLGMIHGSRNDFATAMLFYQRAEELKRHFDQGRPDDRAGLALTYGQIGRLYLDWHALDRAEEYFRRDLELCLRIRDRRGEAQMHNHLGQVYLLRGESQRHPRRDQIERAREYLAESVRLNQQGGWAVGEAYARKDHAAALVALGELAPAGEELDKADALFAERNFREGQAHVALVRGSLRAAQGRYAEGEELLRRAALWFDDGGELANAARAYLKLARLRKQGKLGLPRESLLAALDRAERSRRDALIADVERELAEVDEVELYRRLYSRARGRGIHDGIGAMERATAERATVLFLDLRESTAFVMGEDPAVVRLTLNQLFAALTEALERHKVVINQYLGDGFMALSREPEHARNAVAGALDALRAMEQFNRPRQVLKLRPLEARIGISTGDVVLGNIGTHQKIDFTAVGPTTNEAARLQGKAAPGHVCISQSTYKLVADRFEFDNPDGREVTLAGVGNVLVWDVKGRKSG